MIPIPSLAEIKYGAVALVVLVMTGLGFYGGYRFELSAAMAAKLALANQLTADATATSKANTTVTADVLAQGVVNNNVLAAHQGRAQVRQDAALTATAANDSMATQAGNDGPVAPDLMKVLNDYAAANGTSK